MANLGTTANSLKEVRGLQISSRDLCQSDPLAQFLLRISQNSVLKTELIAIAAYGILIVVPGILFSLFYSNAGKPFLSILDPRELPTAILGYLIAAPLVWAFYIWQLGGMISLFAELFQNEVIDGVRSDTRFSAFLDQQLRIPCSKRRNFVIALTTLLAGISFGVLSRLLPDSTFNLGVFRLEYWWTVNPLYFYIIHLPLVFIPLYMMMWMIIRQVFIVITLSRLFSVFAIRPKIFHPDRSNGLGPIGNYAIRATLLVVLLGFWLSVEIGYPVVWGEQINPNFYLTVSLALYVILVPLLLLTPTWNVHLAMAKAKGMELEILATQIRHLLYTPASASAETSITLEELEKRYRMIDQEFHTWPFQASALRRLIAAALLPLISTVTSLLSQTFLRILTR